MDGFVLAPLAIVGYASAVLVLGIVIRYSGGGKLPLQLEAVSSSSSSLPSPASSSSSSLKSTIVRGVKSATSTLKVAVRIPVQSVHRWTPLTELIAKRWQKRFMLEQLPITASVDDDPIPPAPATPQPVLVDLAETSTVFSPLIHMRVLGTATPVILSPTPLPPTSASNVLATSRSSIFTLDSHSAPSTPPPYLGHKPGSRFGRASPFSPPPPKAPLQKSGSAYVPRSMSPNLVYPGSRPRTPSPVYNNPHFLSTSPILGPHRRTRSFGGISPRRLTAPLAGPIGLPRNGSGTFVAGSFGQGDVEMKPYLHRPLSSRSTELLIDLEDGIKSGDSLINLEVETESYSGPSSSEPSPDVEQLLLLPSPVAIRPSLLEPNAVEFPRVSTNNSWRQWEKEDHDLLSADPDYDVARFNTFEDDQQSRDPFDDLFSESRPAGAPLGEDSYSDSSISPASLVKGDATLESLLLVQAPSRSASESEPTTPSQMPTPPASPPFSILRMPSASSYSASLVDDYLMAKAVDGATALDNVHTWSDLDEGWEQVSGKGDAAAEAPLALEERGDVNELASEALCDDPPLPELPQVRGLATGEEARVVDAVQEAVETPLEIGVDPSFDDPPLPEIEPVAMSVSRLPTSAPDAIEGTGIPVSGLLLRQTAREGGSHGVDEGNAEAVSEDSATLASVSTTPIEEKERPSWSLRASEAPRLGLAAEPEPASVAEKHIESAQNPSERVPLIQVTTAPEPITRSDSIPGAFPSLDEAEAVAVPTVAAVPLKEGEKPSTETAITLSTPQFRRRTTSTIDTTSFAAAVVSLRRKPEPLDVALAMQMRPGVGAGADPAWMVRFMMAVFGWLAVTMSAGID